MAGRSNIDIMGSLNDVMSGITGAKIDLSLPSNTPFAEQEQQIAATQALIAKMQELQKAKGERERQRAIGIQQAASGGAGTKIRAPARIRGRV